MRRLIVMLGLLTLIPMSAVAQVAQEEFTLVNPTSKARLWATVFYPADAGVDQKYPAVVIIPGGLGFGSGAARTPEPFIIARAGFAVGYFDPDGRGRSEGEEDWNGKVHQDGLHAVLKHVAGLKFVEKNNIGVVSSSLGLAMAAGALGRYPDDPPVKYFVDIEGPSDRFYITKNDSRRFLDIFAGHTTKDEDWWAEREAVRSIQEVRCAYLRIQHERDHVHGENKQHAIDMMNAATHTKFGGKGKSPWTRINGAENEPNRTYAKDNPPKWLPARPAPPRAEETLRWIGEMVGSDGKRQKAGSASEDRGKREGLPYEGSPFGFHPATVPPDVGGGDRWACARDIGVRWHRPEVYAFWFLCHPTGADDARGVFQWERLDNIVRDVPAGIHVLWNLSPRNRTQPGSSLPRDIEGYRRYVRAVVERYDGDGVDDAPARVVVNYWQVENEPNLPFWEGTPEQYAELLSLTYQAAKQANACCKIVIGGVGGWTGSGHGSSLEGFRRFYLPVFKRLGGTGFDVFDYHWYGNARGDYRAYGEVHREVRRALDAHGFKHVPIWITEMGSYSGAPSDNPPQTEEEQAADLLKRYVYPLSLGVEKVFWAFGLIEGFKHDDRYFDHTGLIYNGRESGDKGRGVRKLAYHTYKLLTEKLEGKQFAGEITGLPDHVYAYHFRSATSNSSLVTVVWWDWWNEASASIKSVALPAEGKVTITSAITDARGKRTITAADAKDGRVALSLGRAPLFAESQANR